MMVIQVLLIVVLLGIFGYFLLNQGSIEVRAYKKIALLLFLIVSVVSILEPNSLNWIAKKVGVGRGADLVLYVFIMVFMFFVLNVYIKFKQQQDKVYRLARKLSLLEAEPQKPSKRGRK